MGRVDVLVNNVGDFRPNGWFLDTDEEHWDGQYAITLEHVFRCTKAFLPIMVEQGRGAIVNNSTVEAFRGIPRNTVYSAFNAGVVAFTRSLAVEFGKHGVRVNAIAPDMANTLQTPGRDDAARPRPRAAAVLDPARPVRASRRTTGAWCSSWPATSRAS